MLPHEWRRSSTVAVRGVLRRKRGGVTIADEDDVVFPPIPPPPLIDNGDTPNIVAKPELFLWRFSSCFFSYEVSSFPVRAPRVK